MFYYIKQFIVFVILFVSFHFTYNYVKSIILKKKEFVLNEEVFSKYKDILQPTKEENDGSGNTSPSALPSFRDIDPTLEEELAVFMKETEDTVILKTGINTDSSPIESL